MCFRAKIKQIVQNCTKTSHLSIFVLALLLQLSSGPHHVRAGSVSKGLPRMRSAKIASIHGLQAAAESILPAEEHNNSQDRKAAVAGKYEIRTVSGEPNYKSVNLTWEVEFVASSSLASSELHGDAVTNSSAEVEPPKEFQIFFCELQSFGPHRCRSKTVDESQHVEPTASGEEDEPINRQVRHYSAQIDNLRMATKYSFHIREQKRRNMKVSGRSEIFDNEIEDEVRGMNFGGQTIIIPTKGFSAQATKCLPHASEIEVETGPYFGGKIVVDGGNCGVKGNPDDAVDKYTMRIDHKMCGSMVKPETNTVETFITVQENLGIFTHSTRRFVVVCSFQSGMQTVRASFTVPGKDGVAAPVENDPFEPDDRSGREQRQMQYVDKSHLVLKESYDDANEEDVEDAQTSISEESEALVKEVPDPQAAANLADTKEDSVDAVAVLEDIIPGVNEHDIKHENEVVKPNRKEEYALPVAHARLAKYAKLVDDGDVGAEEWFTFGGAGSSGENRAFASSLHYISANIGSVVLTISISVIIVGIFIFVVYREARRQNGNKSEGSMKQQLQHKNMPHKTLPRSLQHQGSM